MWQALAPQWVTSWNSLSAGPQYTWHKASESALLPSRVNALGRAGHVSHSAFTQFSSTCMYVIIGVTPVPPSHHMM